MKGFVGGLIGFGVGFYTKGLIDYMDRYDGNVHVMKNTCIESLEEYNKLVEEHESLNRRCHDGLGLDINEPKYKKNLPDSFEKFKLTELKNYGKELINDVTSIKKSIEELKFRIDSYEYGEVIYDSSKEKEVK
jgi:hypothetical protein